MLLQNSRFVSTIRLQHSVNGLFTTKMTIISNNNNLRVYLFNINPKGSKIIQNYKLIRIFKFKFYRVQQTVSSGLLS